MQVIHIPPNSFWENTHDRRNTPHHINSADVERGLTENLIVQEDSTSAV